MEQDVLVKNLEKKGFTPHVFSTKEAAADYLVQTIHDTLVGIGGSVTVDQLDVYDRLCQSNEVLWHWKRQDIDVRPRASVAETYLCSANAVSQTGEIVNIDGGGNRVAATLFGPERVFLVIGKNKIEPTLEKAVWRARNIAAPLNARRLGRKTPCALGEMRCYDCSSPERICAGLVVLMKKPMSVRECHVLLLDEELGF